MSSILRVVLLRVSIDLSGDVKLNANHQLGRLVRVYGATQRQGRMSIGPRDG